MRIKFTSINRIIKVITILLILSSGPLSAQGPGDPPPPPDNHGYGSHQNPGGGAPLSGGLVILLASSALYALSKYYIKNKDAANE